MIKKLWNNKSGTIGLVTGVAMLIITLAVLIIGLPILQGISDSASLDAGTYAIGVLTVSDSETGDVDTELINVSDYTFELNRTGTAAVTAGHINVVVTDNSSAVTCLALRTAINDNATLAAILTSVNTSTTVTCTYDTVGVTGNTIVTTETMTNGSWTGTSMSGGTDTDSLYTSSETVIDTTESSYSMASVIPTLVIAIPVLGALFALIFIFAGRRD